MGPVTGCGELAVSNFNSKPGPHAHEVSPAILEIIVNASAPLYALAISRIEIRALRALKELSSQPDA